MSFFIANPSCIAALNGVWIPYISKINEGQLEVGDDIMCIIIGGDIRPRVVDALKFLVGKIKTECVVEIEEKG